MYVRAFDGTDWSVWDSFTLTTRANTAPVASVADHSLARNAWSSVMSWVSYSDADSNAATHYGFWDSGSAASSGYFWTPSNARHSPGTTITVSASDLANVWVRGGQVTGAETMWICAFDGTAWGAWDPFVLTTI